MGQFHFQQQSVGVVRPNQRPGTARLRRQKTTLGLLDGRPALLMFDSGFTFTTFDRSVAKYFDRLPKVADQLLDPFWGRVSGSNWFVVRRLDLARAQFTNLTVQFKDLSMGTKHH